jgi:hypothetical protein
MVIRSLRFVASGGQGDRKRFCVSGSCDQVLAHENSHIPAQEEQNCNPLAVIDFDRYAAINQSAREDTHPIAGRKTNAAIEPYVATCTFAVFQSANHVMINRYGAITPSDEVRNAGR